MSHPAHPVLRSRLGRQDVYHDDTRRHEKDRGLLTRLDVPRHMADDHHDETTDRCAFDGVKEVGVALDDVPSPDLEPR